jgi:hypothetical protein
MSQTKSGATTSAAHWDLRHPGLIMKDGEREVHEFLGMWPLKPDADLVKFTQTLAFREFWNPPSMTFSEATTLLGLIRAARWFVGTSTEFGPQEPSQVHAFEVGRERPHARRHDRPEERNHRAVVRLASATVFSISIPPERPA